MSFSNAEFRHTMSRFATGVSVVTTVSNGKFFGLTVSSFCSVSLNPPLVLVCVDISAQTHPVLHQSQIYAVNFLTSEQQYLSERFARKDQGEGKNFEDIKFHVSETGAPLFDEALGYVECRVVAEYAGGDHTIFLGQVVNLYYKNDVDHPASQESPPLLYFLSRYSTTQSETCLSKSN